MRPTRPERGRPVLSHANAPLTPAGRLRLIERCQHRPIAHVAAEAGVSRACLSKWKNRYDRLGEAGLIDQSSAPHTRPNRLDEQVVVRIEVLRRDRKLSARRITIELAADGITVSAATVGRYLVRLGINRRRHLDPTGESNRPPRRITARYPGHMVHLDVKKAGRIRRRRRLARPRPRIRPTPRHRPGQGRRCPARLRLPAFGHRRILPPGLHRSPAGREGHHRDRIPLPSPRVLRRPRHQPDQPRHHRQRRLLPGHSLQPHRGRGRTPPADRAVHASPQRQGRALPADPRRRTPLRPNLDLRSRPHRSPRGLEPALQLPSTPHRRREQAPSHTPSPRRHQRHELIQLVP